MVRRDIERVILYTAAGISIIKLMVSVIDRYLINNSYCYESILRYLSV